jgi:hypothetical protein
MLNATDYHYPSQKLICTYLYFNILISKYSYSFHFFSNFFGNSNFLFTFVKNSNL